MFAIARLNTFDELRVARARAEIDRFDRLHSSQPGYAGSLSVDLGHGRRLTVNLWQSRQAAEAALEVVGPEVSRVLAPTMTTPSQLLGAGDADTDLTLSPGGTGRQGTDSRG